MNILIKLMSIVSLVIAPYIAIQSTEMPGSAREGIEAAGGIEGVDLEKSTAADNADLSTPNLGEMRRRRLSSGIDLNIPAAGIENKLLDFIEGDQPLNDETSFEFNRLRFESGSARITSESREELKNIAEILKTNPNVNIRISGYSDNTGNAEANRKLSAARAASVKNELVYLGIAENRLDAEGYGAASPVASNEAEVGRAQNRRISIRVTKK